MILFEAGDGAWWDGRKEEMGKVGQEEIATWSLLTRLQALLEKATHETMSKFGIHIPN